MLKGFFDFTPFAEVMRRIAGPQAATFSVWLWSAPFSLLTTIVFDRARFGGDFSQWVLVGSLGHVTALLGGFIAVSIFGQQFFNSIKRITILYVSLGAFRGIVVASFLDITKIVQDPEYFYRVTRGGITFFTIFCFASLLVSVLNERVAVFQELREVRKDLIKTRHNSSSYIEEAEEEVRDILDRDIYPAIFAISRELEKAGHASKESSKETSQRITQIIGEVVRPITRMLADIPSTPGSGQLSVHEIQLPKLFVKFESIRPSRLISPALWWLYMIFPGITTAFVFIGFNAAWIIPSAAVIAALLAAFIKFAIERIPAINMWLGLGISVLSYAIAFAPSFLLLKFQISMLDSPFADVLPTPFYFAMVLGGVLISYFQELYRQREVFQIQLAQENEQYARETRKIQQQIWHLRRSKAQLLHGTVQSSLTAAKMRLLSEPTPSPATISAVKDDLERAVNALEDDSTDHVGISAALAELEQTWSGLCRIRIETNANLDEVLRCDEVARDCLNEIAKECVSNSIRHGHADVVMLSFDVLPSETVFVKVEDNGKNRPGNDSGFGSQLLDTLSSGWERTHTPISTIVTISVPFSPCNSQ